MNERIERLVREWLLTCPAELVRVLDGHYQDSEDEIFDILIKTGDDGDKYHHDSASHFLSATVSDGAKAVGTIIVPIAVRDGQPFTD